jgi:O-acetyl-ADP-ribose deacetylase (regulator of RNase III)
MTVGQAVLELTHGDITTQKVDAIVNAANTRLAGGGGVDGAIHRAGGPAIMAECRAIGGCPTGQAVITTGGNLPARYVIHAVGPVYRGGTSGEQALLRSAYLHSLRCADKHGATHIAFPSISTGAYGYPIEDAARTALSTVVSYLKGDTAITRVTFVLFSPHDLEVYRQMLREVQEGPLGCVGG